MLPVQKDLPSMVTPAVLNPSLSLRARKLAILATACCAVFVSFASIVVYTFGIFLKPVSTSFGWSRTEISLAFTLAALTVAVCSPVLGTLLDRLPARKVILPCTVVYALAYASLALLTPHLWHLYAVFVLLGVVGNGTTQLGYARVVSAWFDRERGQALAAVMAGTGLGSMVFPPIAQALISTFGWRFAYAALGALILIVAVPFAALFLYEPLGIKEDVHSPPESARRGALSGRFVAICLALLLFSFATNGLNTHWAALLTDRGLTASRAALVLSFAGGAALLGKLGTGPLLDRYRAGRVASVLLGLTAVGFMVVVRAHTFGLAIASALLVGIGMGAESDVIPYLLTRYFGLERFGVLYGYTWFVYAIAGASGPVVMGAVYDHGGSYYPVLAVSLVLVILASVIFALLPGYRVRSRELTPAVQHVAEG